MKNVVRFLALAAGVHSVTGQKAHGDDAKKEMGPVAFLWPADRPWTANDDNTPPCGSASGPVNRTDFPRSNGAIALVVQDESYNISVNVAYGDNPLQSAVWNPQLSREETDIKPGHVCYSLPSFNLEGTNQAVNATIQIKYTSTFRTNKNETFYACADIRYVPITAFRDQIPCFNVTSSEFVPASNTSASPSASASVARTNGAMRVHESGRLPYLVSSVLVAVAVYGLL